MTTQTLTQTPPRRFSRSQLLALALFVPFTVYSLWVTVTEGYTGFIDVALLGGWSSQVFLDLCVALFLVNTWLIRDARARRTTPWPWVLATLGLGSIAPLLYLVVRPGSPE